jgi:ATP-dependent exoDNAse (exonuclease V) beta subunit
MSPQQIKDHWNNITVHSQNKGNKTHKLLEDSINEANGNASFEFERDKTRIGVGNGLIRITKTNLEVLSNTPLAKKYPKIYQFLKEKIEDGWTLYAEKRIYWFEFLIAGTIDCILMRGKEFMIVDWKTNKKKLEFRSGYYRKVRGLVTSEWVNKDERFYHPLNMIPFCKGHVYTLQLSLYAYLMELWGFKCIGLTLFHILNDEVQAPYIIPYWKQYCENLCIHFSKGLSNSNSTNNRYKNPTSFGIF